LSIEEEIVKLCSHHVNIENEIDFYNYVKLLERYILNKEVDLQKATENIFNFFGYEEFKEGDEDKFLKLYKKNKKNTLGETKVVLKKIVEDLSR